MDTECIARPFLRVGIGSGHSVIISGYYFIRHVSYHLYIYFIDLVYSGSSIDLTKFFYMRALWVCVCLCVFMLCVFNVGL